MILKIINYILFQAAWFSCVLGGAYDKPIAAVAMSAIVIVISLYFRKKYLIEDLILIIIVSAVGFCIDSLNLYFGIFSLKGNDLNSYICPIWLILLWSNLAAIMRNSLSWLANKYFLSAILGAIAGGPCYFAGARMGAVTLNDNWVLSAVSLTITWALVMPLLTWLAHGSFQDFSRKIVNHQ